VTLTSTGFEFNSYQAAAFYSRLSLSARTILTDVLRTLGDVLDGDPITLPLPAEAPAELPRVLLTSKDSSLRFDVALSRADFRWNRADSALALTRFLELAQRGFSALHEAAGAMPGRLALVVHRFKPQEDAGKALARHFCLPELLEDGPQRKGPLNRPEAFELHAFKKFQLGRYVVNSWFRAKSGLINPTVPEPIVLIEQDINTLQEQLEEARLSQEDIRDFHRLSQSELDVIMRSYFPGADAK